MTANIINLWDGSPRVAEHDERAYDADQSTRDQMREVERNATAAGLITGLWGRVAEQQPVPYMQAPTRTAKARYLIASSRSELLMFNERDAFRTVGNDDLAHLYTSGVVPARGFLDGTGRIFHLSD